MKLGIFKGLPEKPSKEKPLQRAGLKKSINLVIPVMIKGADGTRGVPDGSGPEGEGPTGRKKGDCPKKEDFENVSA